MPNEDPTGTGSDSRTAPDRDHGSPECQGDQITTAADRKSGLSCGTLPWLIVHFSSTCGRKGNRASASNETPPSRFESCFLIGSSLRLLCVYIQPIRAHLCIHTVNQGSSGSVYQVAQRRFTVQVAKGGGEAVKVLWEGRRHKTSWTGMRDGSAVKAISSST